MRHNWTWSTTQLLCVSCTSDYSGANTSLKHLRLVSANLPSAGVRYGWRGGSRTWSPASTTVTSSPSVHIRSTNYMNRKNWKASIPLGLYVVLLNRYTLSPTMILLDRRAIIAPIIIRCCFIDDRVYISYILIPDSWSFLCGIWLLAFGRSCYRWTSAFLWWTKETCQHSSKVKLMLIPLWAFLEIWKEACNII